MVAPDTQLGIYRLIERIGAGGMGEVWKAEDTRLGRRVAIKVLPQSVAADAEAIARLRREARMAAQLNHPNIATIHAIEEAADRLFIVMEYVEGEPLSKLFRRGVAESDLCRIGRSVAEALAEAHAKGIVHRDIKPDNIIVSGARVKVLDFGIAKQVSGATGADTPTAPLLTQQGMILGTVHYMSPEQALGKSLDARTDIFSLGVVLYEGATRKLPFQGETVTETMTQIIRDEPIDAAKVNAMVSPGVNAIIRRCMKKNRDERFASASDLAHALEEQLGRASTAPYTLPPAPPTVVEQAPRRRFVWPWAVAAVLVIAAGAGILARRPVEDSRARLSAPSTVTTGQPRAAVLHEAPPPATASITVPAPKIEETTTTVAPEKPQPQPQPQPQPAKEDAHTRLRAAYATLVRRDFANATNAFNAVLAAADALTPREQLLARLGLAIATQDRMQATAIARAIHAQSPNDPELLRIHREFPGMFIGAPAQRPNPRPFGKRRGRF